MIPKSATTRVAPHTSQNPATRQGDKGDQGKAPYDPEPVHQGEVLQVGALQFRAPRAERDLNAEESHAKADRD